MKIKSDYHIHTSYCDGKSSAEEIILKALEKGMEEIGILHHSYTFFDESYCIKKDRIKEFRGEIDSLKEKYKGRINILSGVEEDYYSKENPLESDYVIGSVHYIKTDDNKYIPIDEDAETLIKLCSDYFHGDFYALCEKYFELVSSVVLKTKCDIIGHFDLISKFNDKNHLFDENDPRYEEAWKNAADYLIQFDVPFEINTGGISRGYKKEPYPSLRMISYIKSKGGKFILSSDAHHKDNLMYDFDKYSLLADIKK